MLKTAHAENGSSAIRRYIGRNLRAAREAYSSERLVWPRIPWRSGLVVMALDKMNLGKRHGMGSLFSCAFSMQGLDRQRYALTAADAKRDKSARQAVAPHRVDQLSRQHCTGRADGMAMGDRAAFNVDDLFWQPKLASDNDGDGCEGFIDLGALNGANIPAGALQGLLDRGHGSQPEHPRFDRSDAVGDQACCWNETTLVGPRLVGEHHGRSGVVQSRRIAGGDCAVRSEGRLEPRQCFDRRVGPVVLILVELSWSFFSGHFNRYDL